MEKGKGLLLLTIMVMAVFFLAAPAAAFGPNPDGSRVELISSAQEIGWKGDNGFRVDTRQSLFGVNVGFAPTKNLELSIGGGAVKTAADKVFVAPGGDDGVSDVMMVELAEGEQYYDHQNFDGAAAYGVASGKIKFIQGDTLSLGGFIQGSFYRETEDKAKRIGQSATEGGEGGIEGYSFGCSYSETQTIKILDQWDATLGLTVQADVSKNVRLWTGPFYKAAGGEVLEATTQEYKFRATMTNPETGEVLFDDTWTDTTGEVKSRSLSSDNFGAFVGAEVQVGGWALSAEAQVANKTSWRTTISYFF